MSNVLLSKTIYMAGLVFHIQAEYDALIRAREEMARVRKEIEKLDATSSPELIRSLEKDLAKSTKEFDRLAMATAKSSAELDLNFKKKIFNASQAVNKFTEDIIQQKNVVKDVEADVRKLGEAYRIAAKKTPMSAAGKLSEYNAAKRVLDGERAALFELTQEQAKARLTVKELRDEYSLYKNDSTKVVSANEDIAGSLKHIILTVAGTDAIRRFVSNVIDVAGNFQKMEAVLTNSLGSASKVKEAMDMLSDFGAKTPFQVDELTAAYVKLVNQGFIPTAEQMRKLGDLASSTGKSFDQLTEAIIDAQVGENERLKEFGIRASKNGDTITYIFREQEAVVKNTASAIREYILSLGDLEGVIGANEKISATFVGRLSNIEDELTNQFKDFGEKFNAELSTGIGWAGDLVDNLNRIIPVIGGLVVAYGSYKAAVLAVNAAHKAGALYESIRLMAMYRKEMGMATAAQQAFNIASKANIYASLISLLIGLGTAVYMFTKKTEEASDSQIRLSEASKDLYAEIAKEIHIIDKLFSDLKRAKKGTKEYGDAKQKILDNYGHYLAGLNSEISTLKDQEGAYNAVTEAIKRNVTEKMKEKFINKEVEGSSAKQAEALKVLRDKIYKDVGEETGQVLFESIKEALSKNNPDDYLKIVKQLKQAGIKEDAFGYGRVITNAIIDFKNAEKDIKQVFKDAEDLFTLKDNKSKTPIFSSISDEISNTTKKIAILKQDISDLRSGKISVEAGKTVQSAIEEKTKELRAAEDSLSTLTGRDKSSDNKAEDERKKQLEKQKAIYKELLDLRFQNQQDEINLMKDGSEKKIAQIELDYDKEIAAILAKEKEWKDAQDGKLTKEQTVEIRTALVNSYVKKEKSTGLVSSEQLAEEKRMMNEYLKEYGSYMEKRQAITELYNEKISKALTSGEKLSLGEEMKKELAAVDDEAQKKTSIITTLFSDMSKRTVADIRTIAKEAQEMLDYVNSGEFKTDSDGKGLFGLTKEQFDILSKSPEKLQAIKDEIANVNREADQCETAFNKMSGGLKKVFAAGNDIRKLKEGLAEIEEGMNDVMQAGQFLSDTFSKLGDAFGGAFSGIAEGLNVVMDTMSSAMNGAKAGAMFGQIGAAAGAAIGVVSSLASAIAKIHDKKNEKRIERLQEQIDTLDKSYEKLDKSIQKAYSNDASKLIDQQNKLLEQQKVLIQQRIREEQDKKKTDKDRIKDWQDQIDEINQAIADNKEAGKDAIFGSDIKSAIDDFANAYAEAWSAGEDKADSAKDLVRKMIKNMIQESIKAAASDPMKEIREKLLEFWSDNYISDWEQDYLDQKAQELVDKLDKQFGWADKYFKEDQPEEEVSDNSLKGAYSKASQESIDLLAGQTGAVRVLLEDIRGGMQPIREQMKLIYDMQSKGWEDVHAIRDLSDKVEKNTEQIAENTREIKDVAGKISENTKGTVEALEGTINVKVKM